MQNWTKYAKSECRLGILLFEAFSNHCLANTLEPFRAANRLSGRDLYNWTIMSLDGAAVTSSSGLTLLPDTAFGTDIETDILFVVSSYDHLILDTPPVRRALRQAVSKNPMIAGLDTGAWLMAASGLLDGYDATIHSDLLDRFPEVFLDVNAVSARYVIDRNRITCGGASAAFDLALELIGKAHGARLRLDVEALFLHSAEADRHIQSDPAPRSLLMTRAMTLMSAHIEEPLSIVDIAEKLGTSQKELERRAKAELDASPRTVYRHLRLSAVRRLVETTALPVSEIAVRGGYENTSAMTRAFKQEFGMTPSALRQMP
ncbi:MAG: GlxA family transcriptional regulator [Pseudomonadota bacterium]